MFMPHGAGHLLGRESAVAQRRVPSARTADGTRRGGLEVPRDWIVEDDGYSGATLERPGLERVRDLAAAGDIPVVLVHSPDRLSGSTRTRCC